MTDARLLREEARVWQEPDGAPALLREEARIWRELLPPMVATLRVEARVWSAITPPTTVRPRTFMYGG